MKMLLKQLLPAILLLLIPAISFCQTKITSADTETAMQFFNNGENDKALHFIDSLRNIVTEKDSAYINLILVRAEINIAEFNCEEAIRDNRELLELKPEHSRDFLFQVARFSKYLGQFDTVVAVNKRILKTTPNDEVAYNNLVNAYNDAGQYQNTINALKNRPVKINIPNEYYYYAVAYYNLGQTDSARVNMEKHLTTSANKDFITFKTAAQIYSALKMKEKACEMITTANQDIISAKREEKLKMLIPKNRQYYFIKNIIKEIEDTRKLEPLLCK